jgi:hypothetical protein
MLQETCGPTCYLIVSLIEMDTYIVTISALYYVAHFWCRVTNIRLFFFLSDRGYAKVHKLRHQV